MLKIGNVTYLLCRFDEKSFNLKRPDKFRIFFFCWFPSAQSSKTSSFKQDFEYNQELIDCGPVGMHRKSLEAAEHLKSGGEDSGNDQNGSGSSPHHNHHHQGGPTSSESGQESQDGMGPSSSTSKSCSHPTPPPSLNNARLEFIKQRDCEKIF